MRLRSPIVGYSLPVGDAVSLAVLGILLLALALLVYVYWLDRPTGARDPSTPRDDRETESVPRGDVDVEPGPSDDELVRRWLAEAGGEIPQKELTERSDWSKSKVSRLLSKMEDDGVVEKVSVGRENLIVLVDDEASD